MGVLSIVFSPVIRGGVMTRRLTKRAINVGSLNEDKNSVVEKLIHQISKQIENISELKAFRPSEEGIDKVMFQIEIDNIRYTLLSSHPKLNTCSFSPREQEIIRLVGKGLPNKVIANVLGISIWTVSTYLKRIFAKLGVTRRAAMVARVIEDDLLRNKRLK